MFLINILMVKDINFPMLPNILFLYSVLTDQILPPTDDCSSGKKRNKRERIQLEGNHILSDIYFFIFIYIKCYNFNP